MELKLNIKGMHCRSCEVLISDVLEDLGVKKSNITEEGEATIAFDGSKVSVKQIKKAIIDEGYQIA